MINKKTAARRYGLAFGFVTLQMVVATQLTSCGYLFGEQGKFRDRSLDYQSAQISPPLVVPATMVRKETGELLPIPEVKSKEGFKPNDDVDVPQPDKLVQATDSGDMRIKSKDDHKMLEIQGDVANAQAKVKAFLENTHIQVAAEQAGTLETDWLLPKKENAAEKPGFFKRLWRAISFSSGSREKFQFRTEQDGQVANVSVWHFSKRYSEGDTLPSSVNWNKAEDDSELANDMLDALFAYLQDEKSSIRSNSFLPRNLSPSPRSSLTADGNGFPVLMLEQDFNHAWYQVGEALQKAKIKVEDINRSLGVYYLQVPAPEDQDTLLDVQLKLVQSETGVQVNVQKDDEAFAPIEVCSRILSTIKSHLTY